MWNKAKRIITRLSGFIKEKKKKKRLPSIT